MKRIKLPILVHSGLKPVVTQSYGNKAMVDFYKQKGINIPLHHGVDITLDGTNRQTYGTAIVTPSEGWTVTARFWYSPMDLKGNGIVIQSPEFEEDGVKKVIELRFTHCSEVPDVKGKLPAKTVIGYIGNSGVVYPQPTPQKPYDGTHVHIGMMEYIVGTNGELVLQNANNGVYGLIDPLSRIDITWYDTAPDTPVEQDRYPLDWSIKKLGLESAWDKIKYVLSIVFPGFKI